MISIYWMNDDLLICATIPPMFQNFLLKKMLRTQGVPEAQIDMFISIMEKNPELFKTIASEVKVKMDQGIDQNTASLVVMKKYENELKKLV